MSKLHKIGFSLFVLIGLLGASKLMYSLFVPKFKAGDCIVSKYVEEFENTLDYTKKIVIVGKKKYLFLKLENNRTVLGFDWHYILVIDDDNKKIDCPKEFLGK